MSDLIDDQHIREMSGGYEFYRDFHSVEQAELFAQLLESNHIPYKLEQSQTLLDAAIVGHGLVPPALIKVRSRDFKRLNELLQREAVNDPHFVDTHYLQQMTDKELIDIVRKPVDWNVEDVAVARRILNDRGIPIPKEHIEAFNQKIFSELKKGKQANLNWIVFYSCLAVAGGFLVNPFFLIAGIGMGWYYWQDKTVGYQGQKFYTFDAKSRFYGKIIFYLGWVALFAAAIFVFFLADRLH